MPVSFEVNGLQRMIQALGGMSNAMLTQAASAMRSEAEIEMSEAKSRTPVKTGALRASGRVTDPVIDSNGVSVQLIFGEGVSADYAVEVHENMEMFHPRGGQAKFLESVVLESAPYMTQRIAARLFGGDVSLYGPGDVAPPTGGEDE